LSRITELLDLNPHQKAAVHYINGPLLVLAGAGSGKTTVITRKIAALVREYDISPRSIVAVTSTHKAARTMKRRVADMLNGDRSKELTVATFHAFGHDLLRRNLAEAGLRPGFSIYDAEDSRALLGKLLGGNNGTAAALTGQVRCQIARWKNDLVAPEEALQHTPSPSLPPQGGVGNEAYCLAARAYGEYERLLRSYNALDFDDLIFKPVRLLATRPEVLAAVRSRVHYLLVDDLQDTNLCQYELVRLLVEKSGALTATGDDDQSVGGGHGAHPGNLTRLKEDFPALRIVKLEQNYRSTGRILKAANAVIAHNPHLFEKNLWCQGDYGDALRVLKSRSDEHEAERVVSDLLRHKYRHGTEYRDYAILFRENSQARLFERVLRERRVPHHRTCGTSLFDKTEIKDVMAYLRLLTNPDDDNAFLRVINTPRREIDPATLGTLGRHAAGLGMSLLQASQDSALTNCVAARQLAVLRGFARWLVDTIEKSRKNEPARVVCDMLAELHYEDWLKDTCNDYKIAARRLENVLELVAGLQRLARQEGEDASLSHLVAKMSLTGLLEKEGEDNPGDYVALLTLHAAQGLEFPHVFLAGMEEGLLPHHRSLAAGEVEKERRLAYVGMTRAQKSLTFSYSARRRRGGEIVPCEPSRFLQEIPQADLSWEDPDARPDSQAFPARAEAYLASLSTLPGNG
jgi:ATP-dependent DNA helicase Rep